MNISLTPELEQLVKKKVNSGLYTSASEVIREALRSMHLQDELYRERMNFIQQEIHKGVSSLDAGHGVELNDTLFENIKKQGRRKLSVMKKPA